jgi:hypothetical protein
MSQPLPKGVLIADLVDRAGEFTLAYSILKLQTSIDISTPLWPRYFLLSHSIELSLKAFLAIHGKTAEQLQKEFGHKLNKLLEEATKRGFVITPSARKDIARLEKAHNKHWARYPKEDSGPIVPIEEFEKTALELLKQVRNARLLAARRAKGE